MWERKGSKAKKLSPSCKGPTEWRMDEFANRSGLLRIDPSTQERRFPAVHIILRVTGQLQGAIILVHVPEHQDTREYAFMEVTKKLIIYTIIRQNQQKLEELCEH